MVRTGSVIAAIESKDAVGFPGEHFAEGGKIFGFAIFAEPLDFVFVAVRAKSGEFGDAGIKPGERIGELEGMQRFDFVAVAEASDPD